MVPKLSLVVPDKFYHIHKRGINRENIFIEDRNYGYFLDLYSRHIEPVADTYAYCLMRNHFHLVVRIKETFEVLRRLGLRGGWKSCNFEGLCPNRQTV